MQMSKKAVTIIVSMLVLLSIGCFVWKSENFYADYVFPRLKHFSIFGWLMAYNFRPADYHIPLALFPLSQKEISMTFSCKYEGRHDIQIRNIYSDQLWNSGVSACGQIEDLDGKCYLYFKSDDEALSGQVGNYNYCCAVFLAPEDVPLNKKLRLKVRIAGDVDTLLKHHPTATLAIVKCFDK